MTPTSWRATSARALRAAVGFTTAGVVLLAAPQAALAAVTPTPTAPSSAAPATATAAATPTPTATVSPTPTTPTTTTTLGPLSLAAPLAPLGALATATATACAPTCDLYARAGTLTLPGLGLANPVNVWSFMANETDPVALPGVTLTATAGTSITVTVHNDLVGDGNVALEVPAISGLVPDTSGAAPGSTATYTFTPTTPGTYLYQAGETTNGPRQQAMGLSGVLIVRPADFNAADATTWTDFGAATGSAFSTETTVEISEISPEFNNDPNASNMVEYHPTEFLLNGRPFDPANPAASMIAVSPGDNVLLRYAALGLRAHSIGTLGLRQTEIGQDSQPLVHQQNGATVFLTPGQVTDAVAPIDPAAVVGQLYPVYDAGLQLNNDASPGLGGMFAALQVGGAGAGTGGPVTTNVLSKPDVNDGNSDVTLTAHVAADPGHTVNKVEWFLDTVRASGTGFGLPTDALPSTIAYSTPLPAASVDVTITIPAATLDAYLAAQTGKNGDHTLWVHGMDETNTWGTSSGDVFTLNLDGPIASALTVDPTSTDGVHTLSKVTVAGLNAFQLNPDGTQVLDGSGNPIPAYPAINPGDLVLQGTGDSSLAGWDVQSAQYCIDYTGNGTTDACASGAQNAVLIPGPGSTAALAAVIPQSAVGSLSEGVHHIAVRAHEALSGTTGGRDSSWNAAGSTIAFVVDKHGPVASGLSLDPNPNNGFQSNSGNLGFLDSLKVTATLDDTATGGSTLADGEVFVGGTVITLPDGTQAWSDPQGAPGNTVANGTGATMVPGPGLWGKGTSELAYAYIPLAVVRSFAEGAVTFWVHGKDAAGNWGPFTSVNLTLDKTAPTTAAALTVTGTGANRTVQLTAADAATTVVAAEYFFSPSCAGSTAGNPASWAPCVVDPGQGAGTQVPAFAPAANVSLSFGVTVPSPRTGRILSVRVKDAAGNWSALVNYRFTN